MQEAAYDFKAILDEYQDRVYNQAWRMLGSHEEAEEAAQDAFLRIYHNLGAFRGESRLSSWIFRIVANVCITRLRRKQIRTECLDEPLEPGGRPVQESLADSAPNPEQELEAAQTAATLRAQVRRLPPNWAQALSLHHFEGLSYEEIAEGMGIPRATVATYILRGRRQLARLLIAETGESAIH